MQRVLSALLVTTLCLLGVTAATPAQATPNAANLLTPYDPAHYTDLYSDPGGPVTGATYIFNPTVDWQRRMAFDLAQMRQAGVNTVGLYNLVQMTDAERDTLFAEIERNRMKAVIRVEWYDQQTFAFRTADADRVLSYYLSNDTVHGYTGLLPYLVRRNKLVDVVYLAVNMPVDDGKVSGRFVNAQYSDGRKNPQWAASQPPYADRLLAGLRAVTGGTKLYLSVFYGWDQSYPTPSYAGIAHKADGYFLNNYSYPISGTPADENASTADRLNEPRLRSALDRMIGQYGTAPKVIEYGFHTLDFNNGVLPDQTAGLVGTVAAKRKALTETTAYYSDPAFGVRGTLYFAENLFKPEGNPPATMDWSLGAPVAEAQAEDTTSVQYYAGGSPADTQPVADPTAWGGAAVTLSAAGSALVFYDLDAAAVVQLRYRAAQATDLLMSMNGASPRTLHLPAAADWSTYTVDLDVPLQGAVTLQRPASGAAVTVDWLGGKADNEAELESRTAATPVAAAGASRNEALRMPAGQTSSFTVDPVRGGTRVQIRYAATAATSVHLGGTTVDLPATGGSYATVTAETTITSGQGLLVTRDAGAGDLLLDYLRIDGQYEAESSGGLYNGAHAVPKPDASEGAMATSFDVVGASVVFSGVRAGGKLTFRYRASRAASMTVILNDVNHRIAFPASGGNPATATMSLSIPANAVVIVQRNADNTAQGLSIDWMSVS